MRHRIRYLLAAVAVAFVWGLPAGCETSSHKSVRTYEYNDESQPARVTEEELGSEYQMQSPGETVSPGEMVAPGTVVDDR